MEADENGPKVSTLQSGSTIWNNHAVETLVSSVDAGGQTIPLKWTLNSAESHHDKNLVVLVYDASPISLRLNWEWEVRSDHGPVEHEIRIENRDSREVWLPLQNSFVFDWQTSARETLEQFYVEKGADTPSAIGTYRVPIPDGYEWKGFSSTYAQPRPGEAREIIPYFFGRRHERNARRLVCWHRV
jgi:hypothetical protein